jgi:hypothetical protein
VTRRGRSVAVADRLRHRRAGVATALALSLALAACDSAPAPSASPSEAPIPTPTVTTYTLGTSVWYAGLQITFTTATAVLTQYGGTLTVHVQFQNPGTDDASLSAPIQVVLPTARLDPEHGTELPDVLPGGTSELDLRFDVVGQGSVDGATIVVGQAADNQATVPLTQPSKAVSLTPVSIKIPGSIRATDLRVVTRRGELRWDLPDWNDELPAGHAVLTVTYDAVDEGTFSGGIPFTADNVALTLPDGSTIKPRDDGHSQSNVVLLPAKAQHGLSSRFELPAVEHGRYAFVITYGSARASVTFTING